MIEQDAAAGMNAVAIPVDSCVCAEKIFAAGYGLLGGKGVVSVCGAGASPNISELAAL